MQLSAEKHSGQRNRQCEGPEREAHLGVCGALQRRQCDWSQEERNEDEIRRQILWVGWSGGKPLEGWGSHVM